MTEEVKLYRLMDCGESTKLRTRLNPCSVISEVRDKRTVKQVLKSVISHFQEKLLTLIYYSPVLRTNTRGQGEYPKASELTIVKELCKFTPYVSNKGSSCIAIYNEPQ